MCVCVRVDDSLHEMSLALVSDPAATCVQLSTTLPARSTITPPRATLRGSGLVFSFDQDPQQQG